MIIAEKLHGDNIELQCLSKNLASPNYCEWLNDPEVNAGLESRFIDHTPESAEQFINAMNNDENSLLLGIFEKSSGLHIGNIKLGNINHFHRTADLGYLIGDQGYWGKGIATEAVKLTCGYAFNKLNLERLDAGAYENNIGSRKVLLKSGFIQEGVLQKKVLFEGKRMDVYVFGIVKG